MHMPLSPEVREAASESPVPIFDSTTNEPFVLLSRQMYDKIKELLDIEEIEESFFEFEDGPDGEE